MSEFYINSQKSNLKWERLDSSQMNDVAEYESEKDTFLPKNNEKNQVKELKTKLYDEFSHILNHKEIDENQNPHKDNRENISYLNKASDALLEIEKIAGIEKPNNNRIENIQNNSQDLLLLLNELRILTEKRSKISSEINLLDNSLINVQKKFLDKKRDYDKKISDLKSMSSIYEQSAKLVSKIISEDSNYEQI